MSPAARRCVIVGTGRAGGAFARALGSVGWDVQTFGGRSLLAEPSTSRDLGVALVDADAVIIAVADSAIEPVAAAIPATEAVVLHLSGASGLDVLAPHRNTGSIHPLMSLPDAESGARRLVDGCTFAVDGHPFVRTLVESLGGRAVDVPASRRGLYHATAAVAANHLVALCAQVERLATEIGVPAHAYWAMMSATLDNVAAAGTAAALTGPASRGDWATVRTHLAALPQQERALYRALLVEAAALADQPLPDDLT